MQKLSRKISWLIAVVFILQLIAVMGVSTAYNLSVSVNLTDEIGRAVTDIGGKTEVSGSIAVTGTKATPSEVFIGVYGADSRLLAVEEKIAASAPSTVEFSLKNLPGAEVQDLRVFVWESTKPQSGAARVWSVHTDGLYDYYGQNYGLFGYSGDAADLSYQ